MRKPPLYDEVHALPVIDVHTHFETLTETFGYTMPQYFYYGCYFNCYRDLFDPSDIACVEDGGRDVREQFCALLRLWEKIRDTRTGRLFSGMMQTLGCRMEPDAFEPLLQWYAGRTAASIRAAMPTVRGFVCNSAGHPLYGGIPGLKQFLDGGRRPDEGMFRTLNVTELHSIRSLQQLQELEAVSGRAITDLGSWSDACQTLIDRMKALGLTAFKDVFLYFRSPQINYPIHETAEREMAAFLRGEGMTQNLQNVMMFRIYELAEAANLPMQIHTGATLYTAGTANYMQDMIRLMQTFPRLQFDLLHLNYPQMESYLTVLRTCPNAWGDATWAFTVDPGYIRRYLDWILDADIPQRHCLFGSDRHCAGLAVQTVLDAMTQLLSGWLSERVESGYLSRSSAMELARMWLYENPKTLFHLDGMVE